MASGDSPQPDLRAADAVKKSGSGKATSDAVSRHASVTELELAFSQNPDSTAFVDLTNAYIEQGRFMEAMVVCKKGIKAHPDSLDARILLARVYGAQKKYKRAIQELDEVAGKHPSAAKLFLERGKLRLESGEQTQAITDLKKAIDLDASLSEASALLAERGIEYPEKKAQPPSPPDLTPLPSRAGVDGARAPSQGPRGAAVMPARQRLEGEEELEAIANRVAEERPERGRPKTSVFLAIALVLIGGGLVLHRVTSKKRIEAIDRLTTEGISAFNQDTYGSYKLAADRFASIIDQHDSTHALTLGRLAHVYAILWGEHGEVQLKPQLDEVLAKAEKQAPEVSHTIAAKGLALLYDGKDRPGNAAKAQAVVAPIVQRVKEVEGAPSYADLTLAIIDLELGNYEAATQALGNVKQVLPGSVRAKVWHARAAYRASRLGTSEGAFQEALRAAPSHPGARAGLALTKIVRGDLNGAAEQLVKFDELPEKEISSRDRALAEFARSEVFRAAGENNRALGAYEIAVRLDPGNADFPYARGRALLENEQYKEALPYLKKAVEMEKTRWPFLVTLAEAEMRAEDNKNAEQHITEALARAPDQLEAQLARARYLRRTKSPEAEEYLKKALANFPSAEGEVNLELGRLYRALGRLDDAKVALEAAIERMGNYAPTKQGDIVLSYAKLLKDRGDSELALASYKQASELGNIESAFWIASMLSRGSKEERTEAKNACARYLAAGTQLPYSDEARSLCEGIK